MKKRNQRLLFAILLLALANVAVFFAGGVSGTSVRADRFAIRDTAALKQVIIRSDEFENVLERGEDDWTLNQTYGVDSYLRKVLFAVLNQVAVRRQLSPDETSRLWAEVKDRGQEVTLVGDSERSFSVIGNGKFTRTFFLVDPEEGYEVEITGYRDYVGGIFQLTTDQWRDRTLFRSSFHSLHTLQIEYSDGAALDIRFDDQFFDIAGVATLDTAALVDYIEGLNVLQANEIIPEGKFARYDSLSRTTAAATITAEDIGWNKPFSLKIFPVLPGEGIHLTVSNDGTMAVFEAAKIQRLLVRPSDFEASPQ